MLVPHVTYQAIELAHGILVCWLRNVPCFDATLAAGVDVFRWVGDGNSAHNFAVIKRVDLSGASWNAGAVQCIWWKRNRLHRAVTRNVEGISSKNK